MGNPLSKKEVKQLHNKILKAPSFVSELSDYQKEEILLYSESLIRKEKKKAVNFAASAIMEYPKEYQDENGMIRYWLERSQGDRIITREKKLMWKIHKHDLKKMDKEIERQDETLSRIETKLSIKEIKKEVGQLKSDNPSSDELHKFINRTAKKIQRNGNCTFETHKPIEQYLKAFVNNPQSTQSDILEKMDIEISVDPGTTKNWETQLVKRVSYHYSNYAQQFKRKYPIE